MEAQTFWDELYDAHGVALGTMNQHPSMRISALCASSSEDAQGSPTLQDPFFAANDAVAETPQKRPRVPCAPEEGDDETDATRWVMQLMGERNAKLRARTLLERSSEDAAAQPLCETGFGSTEIKIRVPDAQVAPKRLSRLIANRESARLSRERKRKLQDELAEENGRLRKLLAESKRRPCPCCRVWRKTDSKDNAILHCWSFIHHHSGDFIAQQQHHSGPPETTREMDGLRQWLKTIDPRALQPMMPYVHASAGIIQCAIENHPPEK